MYNSLISSSVSCVLKTVKSLIAPSNGFAAPLPPILLPIVAIVPPVDQLVVVPVVLEIIKGDVLLGNVEQLHAFLDEQLDSISNKYEFLHMYEKNAEELEPHWMDLPEQMSSAKDIKK